MDNGGSPNRERDPRRGREPRRFVSPVEQFHGQAQQRRPRTDDQAAHEAPLVAVTRWLVRATWLLVVVGFLSVGAAIAQWLVLRSSDENAARQVEAMRGQLDEMQKASIDTKQLAQAAENSARIAGESLESARASFRVGERPYVWLFPTQEVPRFVQIKDISRIIWTYAITDYGKSPAINVRLGDTVLVGNEPFNPPELSIGAPQVPNKIDFATAMSRAGVSREEFDRLMGQDGVIKVIGRIVYADANNGQYETTFCFTRLTTGATAYCHDGYGNDVK